VNEEIQRDLAVLDEPDVPKARVDGQSDRIKVQTFLRDLELRPGQAPGVEVCSLYRYFKGWLLWVDRKASIPVPFRFAQLIAGAGFTHQFRTKVGGVDRRLLGMRKESAERVREWLTRHPDTPAERAEFRVRRPRETAHTG
jgi:hypothetical protein